MKLYNIHFILIFLFMSVTVIAQSTDCPIELDTAFDAANSVCIGIGRNQVCYGNDNVNITEYEDIAERFENPGDLATINNIRTLSLSALDIENGYWGIAVMRLLANLDPAQTEDITMLMYGDVEIEDASGNPSTQTIVSSSYANIRRYPDTNAVVMDSVAPSEEILLTGRLEDNTWVRVTNPNTNIIGWVFSSLLIDIDFETLDIVDPATPYFAPMQAFYFSSRSSSIDCASVPRDGLIVQTPEGLRRVTLWVNEVTIDFLSQAGSTATIQTNDDGDMEIGVLEGSIFVSSDSDGYVAVAGSTITVTNSMDGNPSVSRPTSASLNDVDNTTLDLLERDIDVPPPADIQIINEANSFSEESEVENIDISETSSEEDTVDITSNDTDTSSSENNNTNTTSSTDSESNTDVDNAEASGKPDCPGNSCNAPGKNKNSDKGNNGNSKGKNK